MSSETDNKIHKIFERLYYLEKRLHRAMTVLAEAHDSDTLRRAARTYLDEL